MSRVCGPSQLKADPSGPAWLGPSGPPNSGPDSSPADVGEHDTRTKPAFGMPRMTAGLTGTGHAGILWANSRVLTGWTHTVRAVLS